MFSRTMFSRTLFFAAVFATPVFAQQPSPAPQSNSLSCDGPFARNATLAQLKQAFGAANVTTEEVGGAEGEKSTVTALFARDKARRITIVWSDEKKQRGISQMAFERDATWVAGGVRIGSGLAEVETLNGRPFTLSGFEWDYGGTVGDWRGGALEKLPGGCRLGVRFETDPKSPAAARNKVSGDKDFPSSNPNMRAARPRVYEIFVRYPDEAAR